MATPKFVGTLVARVLAFLGARGLRQLGGVWPKVGQYMSTQGSLTELWKGVRHAERKLLQMAMQFFWR